MPRKTAKEQAEAPDQESRNEKVSIAVTASEKRAVRVVAGIRNTDESNLCRSTTIDEIVREFQQVRAQIGA